MGDQSVAQEMEDDNYDEVEDAESDDEEAEATNKRSDAADDETSSSRRSIAKYSPKQLQDLQRRVLACSSLSSLKLFVRIRISFITMKCL